MMDSQSNANLMDIVAKKDGGGGSSHGSGSGGSGSGDDGMINLMSIKHNSVPESIITTTTNGGVKMLPQAAAAATCFSNNANNTSTPSTTTTTTTTVNNITDLLSTSSIHFLAPAYQVADSARTNYVQTLMHMLNGFIGSGILSMPVAFKDGGLVLASVLNPLIGIMSCYCIHLLLSINRLAMSQTGSSTPFDYHELAECAFLLGPSTIRHWAKRAKMLVLATIVATQIGGCCVYFTFMATNLNKFLINKLGIDRAPTKETCLTLILPLVIGINWIRNIRHLTIFSTISNALQITGLVIIFYNLFSQPFENVDQLPAVGAKIPQFFVSTLFIYEGISVSMSLYKAMHCPRDFHRPLGVLNVGICFIIAFYFSLGLVGYIQYGEDVGGTITINLPSTPLYDMVQILYAVAVFLTYPIILYVPIQIFCPIIRDKVYQCLNGGGGGNSGNGKHDPSHFVVINEDDDVEEVVRMKTAAAEADDDDDNDETMTTTPTNKKQLNWCTQAKLLATDLTFRASLVLITYFLAAIVPKLELIISLVGALTSSTVTVIIPAIIHTVAFLPRCKTTGQKASLLLINITLFIIGIAAFGFGFYYSLQDIIDSYKNGTIENGPLFGGVFRNNYYYYHYNNNRTIVESIDDGDGDGDGQ